MNDPLGTWRATADNARLYFEDDQDNKRIGAWCANDRDNQWLRINLGKTKKIRAIATQGIPNMQLTMIPASSRTYIVPL